MLAFGQVQAAVSHPEIRGVLESLGEAVRSQSSAKALTRVRRTRGRRLKRVRSGGLGCRRAEPTKPLSGPKGDARGRRTVDAVVTNSGPVRFIAAGAVCPPVGRMPDSYLVDPASSHMLVSKIKPCMSKYKQIYTVKLRMAH